MQRMGVILLVQCIVIKIHANAEAKIILLLFCCRQAKSDTPLIDASLLAASKKTALRWNPLLV
jgi:hypothetical protein